MKKKYSVLFLVQYLSPGGIEWMVARLASSLRQDSEFEPFVLVYDHNHVDQIDSYFIEQGIPFIRLQKPKGFSWSLIWILYRYCREHKIRIIHTHHLGAMIYALSVKLLSLFSIRVIYTQHSFIHLLKYPRYIWFERFFCYFADSVTAVSNQVYEEFSRFKIKTREEVKLIPNGSLFASEPVLEKEKRKSLRETLIQEEEITCLRDHLDKNWIIYLGRVHGRKGQDHALNAWSQMTDKEKENSLLLFIGPMTDVDLRNIFPKQVEQVSSAFYLGSTNRSIDWFQVADHFLSFSESEGWPLAPMEAIGSGCSTSLSRIEGHQMYKEKCELVETTEAGYLSCLKQIVYRLNTEHFSKVRSHAWNLGEEYRRDFSIESMKNNYQALYRKSVS